MKHGHAIYGLMAEFDDPDRLVEAAARTHAEGYRLADAYTPFPVHGLHDALGFHTSRVPLIVLIGGLAGAAGGFFMQWYASAVSYPVNIGGRPMFSWPAFIPITFEMAVLGAALSAVLGMLALNGLPKPYHPVFNVPQFQLASRNRFFLCIPANDPKFSLDETRRFLEMLNPLEIIEVPN
jgi:hypothetical protein